jgi:hypothetical protein
VGRFRTILLGASAALLLGTAPALGATFPAAADTYTSSSSPSANYGTSASLRLDGSPLLRGLVRFDVAGLSAPVQKATLRLKATSAAAKGIEVRPVASTTWGETTTTHANAPASSDPAITTGAITAGQVVSIDVTPLVTGNGAVSLALTTPGSTALALSSREASSGDPELEVETGSGPPPPPPPGATTLTAVADTYTSADAPSANYGTSNSMRLDGSPLLRGLVRFDAGTPAGPVERATLKVKATSAATKGLEVRPVASTSWGETSTNHSNAPPSGSPAVTTGAVAAGEVVSIDVTPLVSGGGLVSFALTTPGSTAIAVASRETGAGGPRLVIETAGEEPPPDPDIVLTAPAQGAGTSDATPVFRGTAAPSGATTVSVLVYAGTGPSGTPLRTLSALRAPDGTFLVESTAPLPDGAYTARAEQLDSTGTLRFSNANTFTLDTDEEQFVAVADGYVDAAQPAAGFSTLTKLRVDGTPVVRSYLRFDLSSLPYKPDRLVLRLRANSSSSGGFDVRPVANDTWTEAGLTDATAPATGAVIAQKRDVTAGVLEVDVSALAEEPGPVSLALTSSHGTALTLGSRESDSPPALIVGKPPPAPPARPLNPIRAAFYYGWYPNAWSQNGIDPYTVLHPTRGRYDSGDTAVVADHVRDMDYGNIDAAIATWWGQTHHTNTRIQGLLDTTRSIGSDLRWTIYYEKEGKQNPPVSEISSDLEHLRDRYMGHPAWLRINGRPVVFVYAGGDDDCSTIDRWTQANSIGAYLVFAKTFTGHENCANQPDAWHVYGPAQAVRELPGESYTISPGFDHVGDGGARLPRDLARWRQNIRDMMASNAPFQLITTFNEWGEGTSVESAQEWESASGRGAYLDALHDDGREPGSDPVVAAAGDIACGHTTSATAPCRQMATSDLLFDIGPDVVVPLGDGQQEAGELRDFLQFFDPSWGRMKTRIRPVIGNHEYEGSVGGIGADTCDPDVPYPKACGYFDYFNGKGNMSGRAGDRDKGYYAYDVGTWRVYAVNSNCTIQGAAGCLPGSGQEQWLRQDLQANPRLCQMMVMHHPLITSEHRGYDEDPVYNQNIRSLWEAFYAYGGDLVLTGHSQFYERFPLLNPAQQPDPARGIRQITVGTGGRAHNAVPDSQVEPLAEVRNDDTFGVLRVGLHPGGYDWNFRPEAGKTFTDADSTACHS